MQVDTSSIKLVLAQQPKNFQATYAQSTVRASCSALQVDAACTVLAGGANPSPAPNPRLAAWKLGFMQLRILETNWSYYHGAQSKDGAVFIDKVAKQTLGICRDYDRPAGHVFYEGSANVNDCYGVPNPAQTPPWKLSLIFGDQPFTDTLPYLHNYKTQTLNYLDELRVAMGFITTLTEFAGPNSFVHHSHFMWSAIWHFKAANGPGAKGRGPFKMLPGSGFWISKAKRGAPSDTRYLAALNNPTLTESCNEVVAAALAAPPDRQEATDWSRFPDMAKPDKPF